MIKSFQDFFIRLSILSEEIEQFIRLIFLATKEQLHYTIHALSI